MSKYIIELEKLEGTNLWRAKGCNALVFDENGTKNILTPYEESKKELINSIRDQVEKNTCAIKAWGAMVAELQKEIECLKAQIDAFKERELLISKDLLEIQNKKDEQCIEIGYYFTNGMPDEKIKEILKTEVIKEAEKYIEYKIDRAINTNELNTASAKITVLR